METLKKPEKQISFVLFVLGIGVTGVLCYFYFSEDLQVDTNNNEAALAVPPRNEESSEDSYYSKDEEPINKVKERISPQKDKATKACPEWKQEFRVAWDTFAAAPEDVKNLENYQRVYQKMKEA